MSKSKNDLLLIIGYFLGRFHLDMENDFQRVTDALDLVASELEEDKIALKDLIPGMDRIFQQ